MRALAEMLFILAAAVAASFFFDIGLAMAIALAGAVALVGAYMSGDGLRFLAALVVLGLAVVAGASFSPPVSPSERPPEPSASSVGKEDVIPPAGRAVGKDGVLPQLAWSATAPPTGRMALCGGVRMVRQGTCQYGWRPLWLEDISEDAMPACRAPSLATRRRHDRSWDDSPPFRVPRAPPRTYPAFPCCDLRL